MPKDLIGEILENLIVKIGTNFLKAKACENLFPKEKEMIIEAKSAILALMRKCVPEKRELFIPRVGKPKNSRHNKEIIGFNSCVTEMHQAIDKLEV